MRIARFTDGSEPGFGVVEGAVEEGNAVISVIAPHPFGP
ncbi:DUF2437 domain-containing protein, partial [Frankia sp. AvcI1]